VVATAGAAPYVSGLSTNGRLFTATRARPSIYGAPRIRVAKPVFRIVR
jgi:hypothetical protein